MKPSSRIENIKAYYFARKLAEIKALQEQGRDVINLGIGSPDRNAPDSVIETLRRTATLKNASQYQSYYGIPELRNAFANWYQKIYNVTLNPEKQILPLMGSKEAIMHIHLAFCNPGDEVLVPDPGYPTYSTSAKMLGLKIKYYSLLESNNWLPSIADLEKTDLRKCKVIWINYPHMPTGAHAQIAELNELIVFAKMNNLLLVNDNPYSLIQNKKPLSIHACSENYAEVLELNSLSKSHNMAGWRVGVVTGSTENIAHLVTVKSNFDSGMYRPIQLAAVEALMLGDEWFNELNKEYERRAKWIYKILDKLNCNYKKENTGLFVWAKINKDYKNGEALSDDLLYSYNVFATPGFIFGKNGDQYIRFSLCSTEAELQEAFNRINK